MTERETGEGHVKEEIVTGTAMRSLLGETDQTEIVTSVVASPPCRLVSEGWRVTGSRLDGEVGVLGETVAHQNLSRLRRCLL